MCVQTSALTRKGGGEALLESAFLSLGGPHGVSQPIVLGLCWSAEYDSEVEDGAPIHRKRKGGKVTGADGQVPGGEDSDGSTGSRTSRYAPPPPHPQSLCPTCTVLCMSSSLVVLGCCS